MVIFEVAPVAGANLGCLPRPAREVALDQRAEMGLVESGPFADHRPDHPRWFYLAQDRWMRQMVRRLAPELLLDRL